MLLNRVVTLTIFYIDSLSKLLEKRLFFKLFELLPKLNEPLFFYLISTKSSDAMKIQYFWFKKRFTFLFSLMITVSSSVGRTFDCVTKKSVCYIYIYISRIIDFKIMYGIQRRLVSNDCTKVTDPWRKAGLGSCNLYDTLLPCLSATRIPANLSFSLSPPLYRVGKSSLRLLCVIRQAGLDTR